MPWHAITSAKQAKKGTKMRPKVRLQETNLLIVKERRRVPEAGNTVFFTDGSSQLVAELKCHYEYLDESETII